MQFIKVFRLYYHQRALRILFLSTREQKKTLLMFVLGLPAWEEGGGVNSPHRSTIYHIERKTDLSCGICQLIQWWPLQCFVSSLGGTSLMMVFSTNE